ncbi:MAG: hypothetical protein ACLR7Z_11195 [Bilophila wadsworthia]
MTEQMQEAKATPAARRPKPSLHLNTIQTSSEIISVDEPENALPEVSLADLPQLLQTACAKAGWNNLMPVQSRALPICSKEGISWSSPVRAAVRREPTCFRSWPA